MVVPPGAQAPQLVVIRGNSASGKTTLARSLQLAMGRGTANLGQDLFRRTVLREHDVVGAANIGFIESAARYLLGEGWNVIVEGILIASHYADMVRSLVNERCGRAHLFYLEVDLEETLRRHEARALAAEVPSAKRREWFTPADLLGLPCETVLDGRMSIDELTQMILAEIGPVAVMPDPAGDRFL